MSQQLWYRVRAKLDEHDYMAGIERTATRVAATAEVFTPTELVVEMLAYFDVAQLAPGRTVLDPACGDGQFLMGAKWVKVFEFGMSEQAACAELYGVDLMRDNVDLTRARLGGGTIVMGNTLHPTRRLEGQTEAEHQLMVKLFS